MSISAVSAFGLLLLSSASAVRSPSDFALAAIGFLLLTVWQAPPWIVVAGLAVAGAMSGLA